MIWILVTFSILSVGLYKIVFARLNLTRAIEQRVSGLYLANAAFRYAAGQRSKHKTGYDTLYGLRNKEERQLGGGKFTYILVDEDSKININTASGDIISRLPGFDLGLANKLISSALRPFSLKEEILLVEGLTEKTFDGCKDYITVYSDGPVNINTASVPVMAALGMDESLISSIESFRQGPDKQEATADDVIFEDTGEIINKLRSFAALSGAQESLLVSLISQGLISTGSKNFTLKVDTEIMGKVGMRYNIVMDRDSIKAWSEK
ncbi:MAG: helix-hairpin-helix domain-containing protein [Candidatus Omnitrophica bacterium]|nr:helix-hairpin-helix domain-containing protein [Candidatus Omnitrophota bacterium]